jgi:hypothetical protein
MRDQLLRRIAGFCAIAAALLHIPGLDDLLSDIAKQQLYLVIDVLLMFALIGLFVSFAQFRTIAGVLGFAGAVIALLIIRTGPRLTGGAEVYTFGATLFTISLALASLSLLRAQGLLRYAAFAWIGSLVVGLLGKALPTIFPGAIILFCVGFVLAGLELVRQKTL